MHARSFDKIIFIWGVAMMALGVADGYLLEIVSYRDSTTPFFYVLEYTLLPLFAVGLLTWVLGCVLIIRKESARICYNIAALFFAIFALTALFGSLYLIHINIHDWTAMLIFPFLLLLPLSFVFLISAAVKNGK